MEKQRIYLDDVRTPVDKDWVVVRNYDEFVAKVKDLGLENISTISLDHDLGESAMQEYYRNVSPNFKLDYSNIHEKTGLDCAKWIMHHFYDTNPEWELTPREAKHSAGMQFPTIYTHSANPIGSANIIGYINNFLMNEAQKQTCVRVEIKHTV